MIRIPSLILTTAKRHVKAFSTATMPKFQEEKVEVHGYNINYLKVGTGPHKIICLPGALGTIWTDFKPQVEGFDRDKFTVVAWDPPGYGKSRPPEKEFTADFYEKDAQIAQELMKIWCVLSTKPQVEGFDRDKFTVVAWDPPGYGKSRPPEKEFTADFYEKDAQIAQEFMKALEIPKYSVLGWSDGGIIGLILAAKYPHVMNKLVIWGTNSFIMPKELEGYKKTRDIKAWSQRMKQPMIDVYGEEYFATLWAKWCDGMETVYNADKGNICSHLLKNIKCPTLILHGEKDPMVDNVHVSYLHTNIETSRIHLYPEGKHNVHLRYAEDFNKRVQEYLLSH